MKKTLGMALLVVFGIMLISAWPGAALAQEGQKIFAQRCAACHGDTGKGNGPLASNFSPKPKDFCLPSFWQGDVDKKIADTVNNGKGQMVPIKLTPDEIKAVTAFITSTCKK